MRRALALAAVLVTLAPSQVRGDDEQALAQIERRIRELHARGDFTGVRRELLAMYELAPTPAVLFALGQVELNLGNPGAAIEYYERFIATGPSDEQVALAQQAIGAARMRQSRPDPTPDPAPPITPPPEPTRVSRRWTNEDSGLVALGATAFVVGGGLIYHSHRTAQDRSGTLAEYDERLEGARTTRWTGIGIASAGTLLVGVTLLRWRLRPDGVVVTATASHAGASLAVSRRW